MPYPDFEKSVLTLDNRRLQKQCVEVQQILNALMDPNYGWQNHPVIRMWRGYDQALVVYGMTACERFHDLYGHEIGSEKFIAHHYNPRRSFVLPWWMDDGDLHFSHQSNLIRKDWKFYRPQFPTAPLAIGYVWPEGADVDTEEMMATKCAVAADRKHDMQVVRMRGGKHRKQCRFCKKMSQWEKEPTNTFEAKAANLKRLADAPDFKKMTIPALREYAVDNSIPINSKMKKADLVAACSA